jgi:uncharacterized protein (TIGR00375 family)
MEKLVASLAQWGNLAEDGRPTLSLSARDFTSLTLETDPRSIVIPAHAWTPWYSVYGSEGGFDSLEECFGDLVDSLPAVETGLSSDPAMNWRMPELDGKSIVSFSDAHSLPRLGREVTAIDGDLTFDGLRQSFEDQSIAYTIEFFPEEGKYHFNGHRKCGVRQSPQETLSSSTGKKCPRCGRRMTIGVAHRVETLAPRPERVAVGDGGLIIDPLERRPPYLRLVPLQEIIAGALGKGVATKAVEQLYTRLIQELGPELPLLRQASIEKIASTAGERVAEGVQRVRDGNITVEPGYDGVYGKVRIWPEGQQTHQRQLHLTDSPTT